MQTLWSNHFNFMFFDIKITLIEGSKSSWAGAKVSSNLLILRYIKMRKNSWQFLVDKHSDQEFLEIDWFDFCFEPFLNIRSVDYKLLTCVFIGVERYLFYDLFYEGMESAGAEILGLSVHLVGLLSDLLDGLNKWIRTSSVKVRVTFSASSNFCCWKIRLNSGYLRIRTSSALLMGERLTLIGSLPNSSGMRF